MAAVDEKEQLAVRLAGYGQRVSRAHLEQIVREAEQALRSGCACTDDMERIVAGAMAAELLARRGLAA